VLTKRCNCDSAWLGYTPGLSVVRLVADREIEVIREVHPLGDLVVQSHTDASLLIFCTTSGATPNTFFFAM